MKRYLHQIKNELTDNVGQWSGAHKVSLSTQQELAFILVGVPTMWVKHSNLSLYLAVYLTIFASDQPYMLVA